MLRIWTSLQFCLLVEKNQFNFPKRKILDSSKLKKFAYNNFRLDEHGIKFLRAESCFIHSF